jgi:nucleoid-associated protein YgaU
MKVTEITVERGDTLSHIAQRFMGNANRWPFLARFNNLRDPHLIFPRQRIRLP